MPDQGNQRVTDYQLSQVAVLHHVRGLSQQEIATRLGFSKMTVSRMLQRARDQNIVETRVKLPFETDSTWSERLRKEFGLERCTVIRTDEEDPRRLSRALGEVCAFDLNTGVSDPSIIGVGVGRTMGAVVEAIHPMRTTDVHIVQLMGGHMDVSAENPLNIVQELCAKLGATGSYIAVSAFVESAEVRRGLFDESMIGRKIKHLWQECSKAIFGVGSVSGSIIVSMYEDARDAQADLVARGAVGDILGHYFDEDGNFVPTPLDERLVSIPIETLRRVPERCAVAGGTHRVAALRGALKTGVINHLLTDLVTAKSLLAG